MRITLGVGVTRAGVDETITGLWTFANVLGLLTDIIGERTSAAGVTVDGLLIRDAGIPEAAVTAHEAALAILESQITDGSILARLAAAEIITGTWRFDGVTQFRARAAFIEFLAATDDIWRTQVSGDADVRFAAQVSGRLDWGDGTNPADTNLFRDAANRLKTDDAFHVADEFRMFGPMLYSNISVGLTGSNNNFAIAARTFVKITPTNAATITGIVSDTEGRLLIIYNKGTFSLTISHESASSTAANRIQTSTGSDVVLVARQSAVLVYDDSASRWLMINFI